MFDCTLQLADRAPGEIVVLASGRRARVQWHISRDEPETTFVTLFSEFDEEEEHTPKPCSSLLGVRVVVSSNLFGDRRQGVGEKGADISDPITNPVYRVRGVLA